MISTSLVENIIHDALEQQKWQKQAEFERSIALLGAAQQRLIDELGPLWDELKPYAEEKIEYSHQPSREPIYLICTITADQLQLAPFSFYIPVCKPEESPEQRLILLAIGNERLSNAHIKNMGEFLAGRRQKFLRTKAEAEEQERFRKIRQANERLLNWRDLTPETALECLNELIELAPDRTEAWQKNHQSYLNYEERELKDRQAVEKAKEEQNALAASYAKAYSLYVKAKTEALNANRATCRELQTRLDTPIQLYRLEYCLIAKNEEDSYLETLWVYARENSDPATGASVLTINGDIQIRYLHPVSISGPFSVKPSEEPHDGLGEQIYRSEWILEAGNVIYFWPDVNIKQELREITWKPIPDEPFCPPELFRQSFEEIRHAAWREVSAENEVDRW